MDLKKHLSGTFRVSLEDYFHEEAWVEMKDMTLEQTLCLREYKDSEKEQVNYFTSVLETIIVDHNFYDGNKKLGTKELIESMKQDPWIIQILYQGYVKCLFRERGV